METYHDCEIGRLFDYKESGSYFMTDENSKQIKAIPYTRSLPSIKDNECQFGCQSY